MNLPVRGVIVIEVPAAVDEKQAKAFVRELTNSIAHVVRPSVVLDCECVRRVDGTFLHLLVCSLEEAMKRNGDVRLSGLPEAALPAFKSIGIEHLFRFYSTAAQAAESFRRPAVPEPVFTSEQDSTVKRSVRAA